MTTRARYRLSGEQLEFYRWSPLWYEYHAKKSTDPGAVLFHGHASFHHPLLVQGSSEKRSDREHRAVVLNTALDGFRSDSPAGE